jgi:hypothetical protein
MKCDVEEGNFLLQFFDQRGLYPYNGCECGCNDMVKVKKPSIAVMTLSFLAQALVASIVGLNMGFRYYIHKFTSVQRLLHIHI